MHSIIIYLCLFNIVLVEHHGYFGITASKLPGYGNHLHTSAESKESDESGYYAYVNPAIPISYPSIIPPIENANQVPSAPVLSYGTPQVAPIPAVLSGPPFVESIAPTPDIIPSPVILPDTYAVPALSYGTPFGSPSAGPVKSDAASPIIPVNPRPFNRILPISAGLAYGKPENTVKPEEPVGLTSINISPPFISSDAPVGPASYGTPLAGPSVAPVKPVIPENSYSAPLVQPPKQTALTQLPVAPVTSPVKPAPSQVAPLLSYSAQIVDQLKPLAPFSFPPAPVAFAPSHPVISPPGSSTWG